MGVSLTDGEEGIWADSADSGSFALQNKFQPHINNPLIVHALGIEAPNCSVWSPSSFIVWKTPKKLGPVFFSPHHC